MEAIEYIPLDSKEFKRLEVDQVQLLIKRIILNPGEQPKGDKKVSEIPKDKKAQVRKALKVIYPSIPRQHYPEERQWRAIENIADRYFTVMEQSAIVIERIKSKQNTFFQDLCMTDYRYLQNFNAKIET